MRCMKSVTAVDVENPTQLTVDRVKLLEDRLAIVACIVDDCAELVAVGETIPDTIWPRLRLVAMWAENGLSVWRQLPHYRRARTHIRASIADCLDQPGKPR